MALRNGHVRGRYNWGDCRVEQSSSGVVGKQWRHMLGQPGVALNAMSRAQLYKALHVATTSKHDGRSALETQAVAAQETGSNHPQAAPSLRRSPRWQGCPDGFCRNLTGTTLPAIASTTFKSFAC